MARCLLAGIGGALCGLGILAACAGIWLYFGGETFADHIIEF